VRLGGEEGMRFARARTTGKRAELSLDRALVGRSGCSEAVQCALRRGERARTKDAKGTKGTKGENDAERRAGAICHT